MQLFLHMVGDYLTQNHWMANKKVLNTKEGYFACLIHCLLYALPFLFIGSLNAIAVIFVTHFLIDKYRLAKYVIQLKNWHFEGIGFPSDAPPFISVWILFIVDNLIHISINYLALTYL